MHLFFLDAIEEIYKMLLFLSIQQNKYLFTLYIRTYSQNWGPHELLLVHQWWMTLRLSPSAGCMLLYGLSPACPYQKVGTLVRINTLFSWGSAEAGWRTPSKHYCDRAFSIHLPMLFPGNLQ